MTSATPEYLQLMKRRIYISSLLLSLFVPGRAADTVAAVTNGTATFLSAAFVGQSFTTTNLVPVTNVSFNFFSDIPATTPYAIGSGFLLSSAYAGTPAALGATTPGFLGQASAVGGFYNFGADVTLLPATQYFFYENALVPPSTLTGDVLVGGLGYLTTNPATPFSPANAFFNFRVTGTPAGVPEGGSTIVLLSLALLGLGALRRRLFAA